MHSPYMNSDLSDCGFQVPYTALPAAGSYAGRTCDSQAQRLSVALAYIPWPVVLKFIFEFLQNLSENCFVSVLY